MSKKFQMPFKLKKKGKLLIKNTSRNLFITITDSKNQVKKNFTLGTLKFKPYNLYSFVAMYRLGLFITAILVQFKFTHVDLIIYGWTRPIKKILRGLRRSKILFWNSYTCRMTIPHNGCKFKKLKRR